jgi:hypothetical protein
MSQNDAELTEIIMEVNNLRMFDHLGPAAFGVQRDAERQPVIELRLTITTP